MHLHPEAQKVVGAQLGCGVLVIYLHTPQPCTHFLSLIVIWYISMDRNGMYYNDIVMVYVLCHTYPNGKYCITCIVMAYIVIFYVSITIYIIMVCIS